VIKQRSLSFDLENPKQVGNTLRFKPNNAYGFGLGMYVFDLGFELVFAMPVDEEKNSAFGTTRATDLQLNILSRQWGGDIFYQNYKGFYLSNPDSPIPAGGQYPQRPDVSTENIGVSCLYVLRPNKFSLRSSFTFADRQLKSSGSLVFSATYNRFHLWADSVILNQHYATRIGLVSPFTSLNYQTLGIAPGYSYNFIFRRMFLNLSLGIGPAVQWLHYQDQSDQPHSITKVNSYLVGRVALGYSSDRFFCAFTFADQQRTVEFDNIAFRNTSSTARILFGFRFKEVGLLQKSVWSLLPPWGDKNGG
jgi:hypothetical protein